MLGQTVGILTDAYDENRAPWACASAHRQGVSLRIFSNLNLNGPTPVRVQPRLGELGPDGVPTTRSKKRMRIWVSLAMFGFALAIFLLGWYVFYLTTGRIGFGLDG